MSSGVAVPVASIVSSSVVQIVNGLRDEERPSPRGLEEREPGSTAGRLHEGDFVRGHGGLPLDVTVALGGQHDPKRSRGDRREPHELVARVAATGDPSVLDVDVGAEPVGESELAASPHAVQIGERQRGRRVVVHDSSGKRKSQKPGNRIRRDPGNRGDRSLDSHQRSNRGSLAVDRAEQRVVETPVATPGEQVHDAKGWRRSKQRLSLIR